MKNQPFILFADADPATLELFRSYVDAFGWRADYVATARAIIAKVNETGSGPGPLYDAVVCDVAFFSRPDAGVPGLSGVAAARVIRESFPDLPVLFVTNYASYFIKDEINKVGAELFAKPVDAERLFERLTFLVKWHQPIKRPAGIVEDRRREGINRSGFNRRQSDRRVEIPEVLQSAIDEVKADRGRPRLLLTAGH